MLTKLLMLILLEYFKDPEYVSKVKKSVWGFQMLMII